MLALIEATRLLNSTLDLDVLLGIILDLALRNLRAARGTIYLVDHERGELWSKVLRDDRLEEIRLPLGTGLAGHVARSGETLNLKDAATDPRFYASFDRISGFRTRSMLCMPMRSRAGEVIGVFQLLNKPRGFSAADEEFLQTFSIHVALAIENAQYHQAVVEKERAEKELQIAARIQQSLLPAKLAAPPGYEMHASTLPCRTVGGDYLAVEPLPDGRTMLVIADVSGKGVPAALLVSMLHAALRVRLEAAADVGGLAALAARLNAFVHDSVLAGRYITFHAVVLDPRTNTLTSVNAGHLPGFLAGPGGARRLEAGGTPLGLLSGPVYASESAAMAPGDVLLMLTDGVTEATDSAEQEFGLERIEALLARCRGQSAVEIHGHVLVELASFTEDRPLVDDASLLVVRRLP
jgi:serine phosphatase RsbU (regulator of sigma subunit)